MVETKSELDAKTGRMPASQRAGGGASLFTPASSHPPVTGFHRRRGLEPDPQLEYARLVEELHASRLRVVRAVERERRRLEQDLHDGAQQRLVEIQVRLGIARALVGRADLATELDAVQKAAEAALDELRTLARGIYPAMLRDLGPAAALRALAERSPMPIRVTDDGNGRASPAIEAAIYFCAREAIQNATKHAGPGVTVTATLARQPGTIDFTISDDGIGISPEAARTGIGIQGMRDRIEAVGGRLEIFSEPALGTHIHAQIPTEEAPAASHGADAFTEHRATLAC
jgi:signal transduction histidine kinase